MRINDETIRSNRREFQPVGRSKPKIGNRMIMLSALVAVLIVVVVLFISGTISFPISQNLGVEGGEAEVREVLANLQDNSIKQILDLEDSEPIIATIVDADLMRGEDPVFYASAEDNDTVIILNQKRLIILYRKATDSIINIASGTLAVTNP